MKDKFHGQIMKEFVTDRPKSYIYLKDNDDDYKKAKGTKECVVKRKIKFPDYKLRKSLSNFKSN